MVSLRRHFVPNPVPSSETRFALRSKSPLFLHTRYDVFNRRISETVTTQARQLDFVEAARASGTTTLQVIRYHVLANVLGPILVYATSLISLSIILSAGLSFLGLGVTPPQAEWGLMLNSLRQAIYVQPYVAALPGLMIFITSMCFNMVSDGFRSAMDVKLNK